MDAFLFALLKLKRPIVNSPTRIVHLLTMNCIGALIPSGTSSSSYLGWTHTFWFHNITPFGISATHQTDVWNIDTVNTTSVANHWLLIGSLRAAGTYPLLPPDNIWPTISNGYQFSHILLAYLFDRVLFMHMPPVRLFSAFDLTSIWLSDGGIGGMVADQSRRHTERKCLKVHVCEGG